jgi:hypothetical protein
MPTATAYDRHVDQLFERMREFHSLLTAAGVPYRIVGGIAVYLHVADLDPLRARMTADVDAAIDRRDLPAVIKAASDVGWTYRHVAGVDMLLDEEHKARSAVHLIFLNEKVRPEYPAAVPDSTPTQTSEGFYLASVADLVRMKLTSYRLKDKVHIQDMDGVGLITAEIEADLPDVLLSRLHEIRATE